MSAASQICKANRIWTTFRLAFWLVAAIGFCLCAIPSGVLGEALKTEEPKTPSKVLPMPGEVFSVEGHTAFLIPPTKMAITNGTPWVWYAPTLPGLPGTEEKWMFEKFTAAGIAVAGIDVGESHGSPNGRALYSALYEELVQKRRFSSRPCLLARSRGGLMLYNWAAEHPTRVACIAGIYPVCDLRTYPGLTNASAAYGVTVTELTDALPQQNPINRLQPLAESHVPIFHIHGDADTVVPLEQNSGELARRYRQLGGEMILKVVPGQGHNMWPGWFQCQELVDFVIAHAREGRPAKPQAADGR
jgi:predicted esterase